MTPADIEVPRRHRRLPHQARAFRVGVIHGRHGHQRIRYGFGTVRLAYRRGAREGQAQRAAEEERQIA